MIDRRKFIARGAAGLAGILASRQAPALAQTIRLHLLHRVDFIPQGEAELKRQLADYGRQMKMDVVLETINENDLQTRITSAIQSGAGPDIVQMLHNWPHLYAGGLVDMTDLCDWKQRDQGKFYPQSEAATREGSRWLGLPHCVTPALINYRKSWFAEAGATAPPKNLDEYRKLGAVLKKKGKPFGQTLGHTVNDAPGWSYPLTWTFGGAETDKTGKKVVLNSKNTIEAVKWMTAFWKEACDEGGLAWDDTTNNRAFHAGEIAATLNGGSIYVLARRRTDIKDEKGQSLWPDIGHFRYPDGPHGPTPTYHVTYASTIMKHSKNVEAAKELLKWVHSKEQFGKWFELEGGYATGANPVWEGHKMWTEVDEAMRPFKTAAQGARALGYAGPPSAKATLVYTKYIITDMYAKAVQGLAPEDAVRWAEGELRKIYEV
ncbi:MAG: sugar ABC transporter substrate-binding protein [Candidatus Rokuibacteriota bacterium]|nr:MAG: sugar ABC transporter substrate-binding protein [Candidatus Rokubacteria bacterium]